MRVSPALLMLALAAPACFTALPDLPPETDTGTATSVGASETSRPTGTDASDLDPATTGAMGTSTGATEEGLFACDQGSPCEAWTLPDCEGACAADAAGTCVLQKLKERSSVAVLQVRRCAGDCTLEVLQLRGSGGAELARQRASVGADDVPTDYEAPKLCVLRGAEFFTACLAAFTAPCADPEQWFEGCTPLLTPQCPK